MFCKCNNIEIKTTSQVIPSYPGPISAPIGASWNGLQLDCVEFFKEVRILYSKYYLLDFATKASKL